MSNHLVIHVDDLGLQNCVNQGILSVWQFGLLTSVSIRVNGMAFEDAKNQVLPLLTGVGKGIHLCLTEGNASSKVGKSSVLFDSSGHFRYTGAGGFAFLSFNGTNKKLRLETESEFRAQIELARRHMTIDHLNSHHHTHMIPWVFEMAVKLAGEYGIPFIRIPKEPFCINLQKGIIPGPFSLAHYLNLQRLSARALKRLKGSPVKTNNCFLGLLYTNAMSETVVLELLTKTPACGITELLFHPGVPTAEEKNGYIEPYVEKWCRLPNRRTELDAMVSESIKHRVQEKGYILTNYAALAKHHDPTA